jgi:hypothetical protein
MYHLLQHLRIFHFAHRMHLCETAVRRVGGWCEMAASLQQVCLQSRSLATVVSAGFTVLVFGRHATILLPHCKYKFAKSD